MVYGSLNVKSDYSLLKSMIKIKDLINFAVSKKIDVLGLCDNNLCGSLEFYNECIKNNIKPIIGLEVLFNDKKIHLIAKNYDGYCNLLKISRYGSSIENLKRYCFDLILVLGFDDPELNFYDDIYYSFGNNSVFFKDVLSLDSESSKGLRYLYAIDKGVNISEIEDVSDCNFSIINDFKTEEIINKCNLVIDRHATLLKYPCVDSYSYLKELIKEHVKEKFGDTILKIYLDRLKYEIDIINKMGFCDYFLVVYDYVKYARENGIAVGPGRGSAAGSLVSYILNITEIDPIKYGLLFERFLNPERITMPDIDIDFEFNRREEVIDYCVSKYGTDRVSNIIAFGTLKSRAVIRDLARVMGIDDEVVDPISKHLDQRLSLNDNYNNISNYLNNYELKKMYKLGMLLEGLKRNVTVHAAGVVMCDEELSDYIPMVLNGNNYISGFVPEYLEQLGLLKMDFLGLKNLSILKDSVNKTNVDIYKIPENDFKTLDLFRNGNTLGIFQFESAGMIDFLKKLEVSSFDDIVAANALFRPGPANNIDLFIARKKGNVDVDYYDPRLESILRPTYGVMIYQEQIMLIASTMAGYSLGEADILRRAMSKKKSMEGEASKFIERSIANGFSEDVSKRVFGDISKFAQYGFNKAHSVAYAMLAYRMAYMKAHYSEYFYVSLLTYFSGDNKIRDYIFEARLNGVKFNRPDINISFDYYTVSDGIVYLPFSIIKNIGINNINMIVNERRNGKYLNVFDFVKRVSVNKNVLQSLILSGCFDSFQYNRRTLFSNIDVIINYSEIGDLVETTDFELVNYDEFSKKELLVLERDYLGFNLNNDLIVEYSVKYPKSISLNDVKANFDKNVDIVLMVSKIRKTKTKNGSYMAFIVGTDNINMIDLVIFPTVYENINNIEVNDIIFVNGRVEKRYSDYQIVVKDIKKID